MVRKSKYNFWQDAIERYSVLLHRDVSKQEEERSQEILDQFLEQKGETTWLKGNIVEKVNELIEANGDYAGSEEELRLEVGVFLKHVTFQIAQMETDNGRKTQPENLEALMFKTMEELYKGMVKYWDNDQRIHMNNLGGGRGL